MNSWNLERLMPKGTTTYDIILEGGGSTTLKEGLTSEELLDTLHTKGPRVTHVTYWERCNGQSRRHTWWSWSQRWSHGSWVSEAAAMAQKKMIADW